MRSRPTPADAIASSTASEQCAGERLGPVREGRRPLRARENLALGRDHARQNLAAAEIDTEEEVSSAHRGRSAAARRPRRREAASSRSSRSRCIAGRPSARWAPSRSGRRTRTRPSRRDPTSPGPSETMSLNATRAASSSGRPAPTDIIHSEFSIRGQGVARFLMRSTVSVDVHRAFDGRPDDLARRPSRSVRHRTRSKRARDADAQRNGVARPDFRAIHVSAEVVRHDRRPDLPLRRGDAEASEEGSERHLPGRSSRPGAGPRDPAGAVDVVEPDGLRQVRAEDRGPRRFRSTLRSRERRRRSRGRAPARASRSGHEDRVAGLRALDVERPGLRVVMAREPAPSSGADRGASPRRRSSPPSR